MVFVIAVGGWVVKSKVSGGKSGGRAGRHQRQSEMAATNPKKATFVQKVTVSGAIKSIRSTTISAPYEGYVRKIFVVLGQKVKKGDPLVTVTTSLSEQDTTFPIRAPFDGTIVHILKTEGQAIKPSGDIKDYILRLDDMSEMFVDALTPEMDITKINVKDKCIIKASAVGEKSYTGYVKDISLASQAAEEWSRRQQVEYAIKIAVKDPDKDLKPGMSTLVDIITLEKPDVLSLPHEYIYNEGKDYFVFLKSGEKRQVKVGMQNETEIEITEGITEKDEVQPIDFLKMLGS
jgi:multidrug efflux pump subunit AcrA (membrane-fusion protein)